jgi:charged multivesicular body protein 2A
VDQTRRQEVGIPSFDTGCCGLTVASCLRCLAMYKMNKAVDVPAITKMMAEFEKENAKTEIMQEIMGDTLDDAMADENAEEEEEQIVNQVLDEIGITFGEELPEAAALGSPGVTEAAGSGKVAVAETDDPALSELEARLNNLKR